MEITFLEEGHKKKFAVLPYETYLRLLELAADETDYRLAVKILKNSRDKIINYDSARITESPIALRRKSLGLSQKDLAKKLKVDPSYVSRLEQPRANPSKATLLNIAQALDCSIEELL